MQNTLVSLYVKHIKLGKRKLEDTPIGLFEEVKKELEKDDKENQR